MSVYHPPPGAISNTVCVGVRSKNCSVSFGWRYTSRARARSLRCDPAMAASSDIAFALCVCDSRDESRDCIDDDAQPVRASVRNVAATAAQRVRSGRLRFMAIGAGLEKSNTIRAFLAVCPVRVGSRFPRAAFRKAPAMSQVIRLRSREVIRRDRPIQTALCRARRLRASHSDGVNSCYIV